MLHNNFLYNLFFIITFFSQKARLALEKVSKQPHIEQSDKTMENVENTVKKYVKIHDETEEFSLL